MTSDLQIDTICDNGVLSQALTATILMGYP